MGCQQSVEARELKAHSIHAVGQTERLQTRAARLSQKQSAPQKPTMSSTVSNASNSTTSVAEHPSLLSPPKLDQAGKLLQEEVVRRTASSVLSTTVQLGTPEQRIQVEYAHWTQRGYYPDDPHKQNQDELSINCNFASEKGGAMFAVYDGHGKSGHDCSRFCSQKLPKAVSKFVAQARVQKYKDQLKAAGNTTTTKFFDPPSWPLLSAQEYQACCEKAFMDCSQAMLKAKAVESSMSGTTAVTVNFHGNNLVVGNVGDSRAVLGHWVDGSGYGSGGSSTPAEEEKTEIQPEGEEEEVPQQRSRFPAGEGGTLLAIPLSNDQTPYRKDERERVQKLGAEIMTIDQKEGLEEMHENWAAMDLGEDVDIEGDPPRVWIKGKDYPGTAFTRSFGDSLAKDIGVTAEPEMIGARLTPNDHILVIASDGIFEFLTNQRVIDICTTCESPLKACELLVKAAYDKWITYENRTDDITVIVCFLNVGNGTSEQEGPTTEDLRHLAKAFRSKPRPKHSSSLGELDGVPQELDPYSE